MISRYSSTVSGIVFRLLRHRRLSAIVLTLLVIVSIAGSAFAAIAPGGSVCPGC